MPWFDLPLDQLREYRTDTAEPPELDLWWQLRLAQARGAASPPTLTRYEADIYAPVEVYDAEFSGAGGDRIRAWYLRPAGADGQTPVVVKFIGYGGGPGELRVVHLDRRVDVGFVSGQRRRPRRGARLGQAKLPPLVKIWRFRGIRAIFTQLVQ